MRVRVLAATALAALVATTLAACGGASESDRFITVYNAQHEELLDELAPKFTKKTGIDVKLRNGKDFELGNQLVQEGEQSPADVFLTENSPAMSLVESKGLFAPIDQTSLDRIPEQYRPESGAWTGFVARSTVLVYDKDAIEQGDLPESILDLAKPEWQGRTSFSPSGADFQAIVSAVLQLEGEETTQEWLDGIAENGTVYQGNNVVMNSVNDSQVETGVIYHYYWFRDQKEAGENSNDSQLHFFGDQDPGAFVSVSGAGVLKASKKQKDAQRFVDYLTDVDGQQALADSYALEYPLNPEVELEPPVKKFSELEPPKIDLTQLNGPKVIQMMQKAGLL